MTLYEVPSLVRLDKTKVGFKIEISWWIQTSDYLHNNSLSCGIIKIT